jgi:hypothetical protein
MPVGAAARALGTVTAYHAVVAVRLSRAHRRWFLGAVFAESKRAARGWHGASFWRRGLTDEATRWRQNDGVPALMGGGGDGEILQCHGVEMDVGLGRIKKRRGRWWCSPRKWIGGNVFMSFVTRSAAHRPSEVDERHWGEGGGGEVLRRAVLTWREIVKGGTRSLHGATRREE